MAWKKNNGAASSRGPPLFGSVLQKRKIVIICMAQDPFEMLLFFYSYSTSISDMISVRNLKPPFGKKKISCSPTPEENG